MKRKKLTALICALAVLAALPAPQPAERADAPLELELGPEAGPNLKPETDSPPLVALTFDDGPRTSTTGPLLDGLALREVPATFFLVGNRIQANEDLVRRMAAEGHQIGIHTFDHVELKGLSRQEFDLQVGGTRELVAGLVGEGEYWLRPPYGFIGREQESWCGGPVILWSVDPEDWRDENIDRITAAVVDHVSDGDIILLHDLFPASAQAALRVVDILQDRGYCFVTVEQLMEQRGVTPEAGVRYRRFPPGEK